MAVWSCVGHYRIWSGQTGVQSLWPEGPTGLQDKGLTCCLLWEHEAEGGDSPPRYDLLLMSQSHDAVDTNTNMYHYDDAKNDTSVIRRRM